LGQPQLGQPQLGQPQSGQPLIGSVHLSQPSQVQTKSVIRPCLVCCFLLRLFWFKGVFGKHPLDLFWVVFISRKIKVFFAKHGLKKNTKKIKKSLFACCIWPNLSKNTKIIFSPQKYMLCVCICIHFGYNNQFIKFVRT